VFIDSHRALRLLHGNGVPIKGSVWREPSQSHPPLFQLQAIAQRVVSAPTIYLRSGSGCGGRIRLLQADFSSERPDRLAFRVQLGSLLSAPSTGCTKRCDRLARMMGLNAWAQGPAWPETREDP